MLQKSFRTIRMDFGIISFFFSPKSKKDGVAPKIQKVPTISPHSIISTIPHPHSISPITSSSITPTNSTTMALPSTPTKVAKAWQTGQKQPLHTFKEKKSCGKCLMSQTVVFGSQVPTLPLILSCQMLLEMQ